MIEIERLKNEWTGGGIFMYDAAIISRIDLITRKAGEKPAATR